MDRRLPLLGLCVFLGPFGGNAILSILFELERELSTDVATVTLSITVFMLPFAAIQLFSGPMSDLWDRRGTIVAGLSLYAAGAVACGLSGTIGAFLIGRVIQGFGFAFVNPVALAAVGELTRPSRRGRAMGWMGSLTTLGTATGPLYGGAASALDWRLAFHGLALASLVLAALLSCCAPLPRAGGGGRRAVLGLLRSAARDRGVALVSACGALGFIGYGGVLSLLSEYLSRPPFGLSAAAIGSIISASGAAGILFSPLAGWSADRLGRARTSVLGLALAGALMSGLGAARDQATLAALFFATGAAMAFGWAGLMTLAVELRPEMRGTSSSLFNASRFLGYAAAPQLMAAPFLLSGMGAAFLLAAASLLAASALAASLGSRESGEGRGGRGGGV